MPTLTPEQISVIEQNTQEAIKTGLSGRYFEELRQSLDATLRAQELRRARGDIDGAERLDYVIPDMEAGLTSELHIIYKRLAGHFVTLSVGVVDIRDGTAPRDFSNVTIGRATNEDPYSFWFSAFLPGTVPRCMAEADLTQAVEGFNRQKDVGLVLPPPSTLRSQLFIQTTINNTYITCVVGLHSKD